MIAVLTGDIVSSRQLPDKRKWLKRLQEIIEKKSGLSKPKWSVFRGDGFQVEIANPADALRVAILIRAGLKSVPELHEHRIDARIGIGIGEKGYVGSTVNESDGEAYQNSGGVLDSLVKQKLEIKSPWPSTDRSINVALSLASAIIDEWTQPEAEIVWLRLTEEKTQVEIAKKLKITQPAVHKRYAGAHLNEIEDLIAYFSVTVNTPVHQ